LYWLLFWGHVAYLAATLPEIQATASFYSGGGPARAGNWSPGEGPATITRTPEIKGTIYGFFGMEDASISAAQIEAELQKHRISHRIFRYDGADHGFCSIVLVIIIQRQLTPGIRCSSYFNKNFKQPNFF